MLNDSIFIRKRLSNCRERYRERPALTVFIVENSKSHLGSLETFDQRIMIQMFYGFTTKKNDYHYMEMGHRKSPLLSSTIHQSWAHATTVAII